jgi:hypothetical protein
MGFLANNFWRTMWLYQKQRPEDKIVRRKTTLAGVANSDMKENGDGECRGKQNKKLAKKESKAITDDLPEEGVVRRNTTEARLSDRTTFHHVCLMPTNFRSVSVHFFLIMLG